MKNKIVFAAGLATGYVLGTRAGRDSYEQLKTKADELWNNPKIQGTVSETTEALKKKAPEVQEQATEAVRKARETVTGVMHRADKGTGTPAQGTGPSGGNPRVTEETPFQNQAEDTRPPLEN